MIVSKTALSGCQNNKAVEYPGRIPDLIGVRERRAGMCDGVAGLVTEEVDHSDVLEACACDGGVSETKRQPEGLLVVLHRFVVARFIERDVAEIGGRDCKTAHGPRVV